MEAVLLPLLLLHRAEVEAELKDLGATVVTTASEVG